jgi:hypothetical protein
VTPAPHVYEDESLLVGRTADGTEFVLARRVTEYDLPLALASGSSPVPPQHRVLGVFAALFVVVVAAMVIVGLALVDLAKGVL